MAIDLRMKPVILLAMLAFLFSCNQMPAGLKPVSGFNKQKYLGRWYEIARFDFRFEKNMNQVTATYSLNDNGTIKVENRGYDTEKGQWKEITGKAKFAGSDTIGSLKVSFFGPFYAGYNVAAINEDYRYALVIGQNTSYMWLLSRETSMPEEVKTRYLKIAEELGCKTSELVWTEQPKQP